MEIKEISRRLTDEIWNEGNLDVIGELVSPDYVGFDPVIGESRGIGAFKDSVLTYRTAFPDVRLTIDQQIAEGDTVVDRWTARATHRGELMGIAPTGKEATVTGITIGRFVDGKLVEGRTNWDALGLFQQLGIVQAPTPTQA